MNSEGDIVALLCKKTKRIGREIVVDTFAGGGGTSLGITNALGKSPHIAINHCQAAIEMHEANHPDTIHMLECVWKVNPRDAIGDRPIGLLWLSPDCRHFSRAKGGVPVKKNIRSLAWVGCKWAAQVKPRVIILENVREFKDWGPLVDDRPCPNRKGQTFRRFINRLKSIGYHVQWKELNAADFGAPTHRRRLFLIARCDGQPIVWPEPTHGDPKKIDDTPLFGQALKPWRTAAEIIDWSIPCRSIFGREKPLADKTLKRIANGIKRYVLDNPKPFIVPLTHAGDRRTNRLDEPLPTITCAKRGEMAIIAPHITKFRGQSVGSSMESPLPTITGGAGAVRPAGAAHALGVVAATLIQSGYGEREGQSPRILDIKKPLGTVVAGGAKHALATAFLAKHYGDTGQRPGCKIDEPTGTITACDHHALIAANMIHLNHGEKQWSGVDEPLRTQTTANHAALVYSFMVKYFGAAVGQAIDTPLHTVTSKDRFGLVTVNVNGEPYVIVDIGMRMLAPRELARAQGFPDSYKLTGSKSNQVARIGNSVCPIMAEVLVKANYRPKTIR